MNDTPDSKIDNDLQLMSELERLQQQIEEMEPKVEKYDQMETENSKLSSQNKKLREQVQEDADEIVSLTEKNEKLNERIGRMSDSDKELKQAERIRSEAWEQKSANEKRTRELDKREEELEQENIDYKAACDREVERVRNQCEKDNREAARRFENATAYETQTKELLDNEKAYIQSEAEALKAEEIQTLRKRAQRYLKEKNVALSLKYRIRAQFDRFVFILIILFSVTFGIFSERLREDVVAIWEWLANALTAAYKIVNGWGQGIEKWLKTTESFDWLASPAHILILLLALAAVAIPLIFPGIRYIRFLRDEDEFDDVSRWIMAGTGFLCISVSRVEPPILKNWNLVLIWLTVQALVPVVKGVCAWWGSCDRKTYGAVDTKGLPVKTAAVVIVVVITVGWVLLMRHIWHR